MKTKTNTADWVRTFKSAMIPIDFFALFNQEDITFLRFRELAGMTSQGVETMLKRGTMKKSLYEALVRSKGAQMNFNIEKYVIKKESK